MTRRNAGVTPSVSGRFIHFSILFLLACPLAWAGAPPPPIQPVGGLCDMGVHPAATLLVPYFEVDPGGGLDTVVTITNTADRPVVARVVIWNVDGWAVAGFNLWLWKYDQAEFSLRWLLEAGHFPNNGCPTDATRFRVDYADCDGDGRYMDNAWTQGDGLFSAAGSNWDTACYAPIAADVLANWQCKLSIGSYDGWSENYRGYVTIDATLTCSGGLQDVGTLYFATDYLDTDGDGTRDHGLLENSNVLMGDILYLDRTQEQGDAVPAVHIEAWGEGNSLEGHTWGLTPARFEEAGISTFWNKYEYFLPSNRFEDNLVPSGTPPNDCREPLPVGWAFRYIENEAFLGETWIDIWRSHHPIFDHWYAGEWAGGGACDWGGDIGPAHTTLYNMFDGLLGLPGPSQFVSFDEEGNTFQFGPSPSLNPDAIRLATQRTRIAGPDFPLIDESGWIAFAFDTDQYWTGPDYGNAFDQSWINVRYGALGRYTTEQQAVPYRNGCALEVDPGTRMLQPVPTH